MNRPATQARVAIVVSSLFRSWPSLVGFAVAPIGDELVLTDVEASPWPADSQALGGAIAFVLHKLIDDEPATRELLLGRTFVRTLH
ncbi:MAG TPA: hypothetical protein VNC62_17600 [Burkholderiales bacterium]|jgi:hypothetical protein|nr:hypothetical protein [Burkholderiales bacterium]